MSIAEEAKPALPFIVQGREDEPGWMDGYSETRTDRFATFHEAEQFAREIVEEGRVEIGGRVAIVLEHDPKTGLAWISKDALGRVWTDLDDKAVRFVA